MTTFITRWNEVWHGLQLKLDLMLLGPGMIESSMACHCLSTGTAKEPDAAVA